jgi:hypothetical protein
MSMVATAQVPNGADDLQAFLADSGFFSGKGGEFRLPLVTS